MRKTKLLLLFIISVFVIDMFSCATKKPSQEESIKMSQYYFKLGVSYINSGNIAEAIYNLNRAYSLNPNSPDILNALGIAYTKVGELDKAHEYFIKAIKIAPNKPESYVNLGILLAKKKDYGSALNYLKKAAEHPEYKNKEKAYYNMALIHLKLGNFKEYEYSLKKAIAYNSFFLPAYEELGRYYMKQKQYKKAKKIYEKAISVGLGSPEIYYNLGLIFYKEDNKKLAAHYLNKALILAEEKPSFKVKIQKLLTEIDKEIKQEEVSKNKKTEKKEEKPEKQVEVSKKKEKIIIFPNISKNKFPEYIPRKPVIKEKKQSKKEIKPKIFVKKIKPKKKKVAIKFFINLGTFPSKEKANQIKRKLELYGYDAKIEKEKIDGTIYYRVYVGYFNSYLEASRFYKENLKPIGFRGLIKFKRVEYDSEKG